jgi:hypothetical protein
MRDQENVYAIIINPGRIYIVAAVVRAEITQKVFRSFSPLFFPFQQTQRETRVPLNHRTSHRCNFSRPVNFQLICSLARAQCKKEKKIQANKKTNKIIRKKKEIRVGTNQSKCFADQIGRGWNKQLLSHLTQHTSRQLIPLQLWWQNGIIISYTGREESFVPERRGGTRVKNIHFKYPKMVRSGGGRERHTK